MLPAQHTGTFPSSSDGSAASESTVTPCCPLAVLCCPLVVFCCPLTEFCCPLVVLTVTAAALAVRSGGVAAVPLAFGVGASSEVWVTFVFGRLHCECSDSLPRRRFEFAVFDGLDVNVPSILYVLHYYNIFLGRRDGSLSPSCCTDGHTLDVSDHTFVFM